MSECASYAEGKQRGYIQVHGIQEEETETFHLRTVTLRVFSALTFFPDLDYYK
jgi:hypothetical protein